MKRKLITVNYDGVSLYPEWAKKLQFKTLTNFLFFFVVPKPIFIPKKFPIIKERQSKEENSVSAPIDARSSSTPDKKETLELGATSNSISSV